jgi:Holliday junction resolvase RusA-like endonuclease
MVKRAKPKVAATAEPGTSRLVINLPATYAVFFAMGRPVPQPRHSVGRGFGRFPQAYIPSDHPVRAWKAEVEEACAKAMRNMMPGRIALAIELLMPRPGDHWTKSGKLSSRGVDAVPRGDWDNIAKAIQDAMVDAGRIEDDRFVVGPTVVWKRWAEAIENVGAMVVLAPADEVWCVWGARCRDSAPA